MTVIYGIKNCDTMKKAIKWLNDNQIEFTFHDYKKEGLNAEVIQQWVNELGWESLLNKRGTTWRKLDEELKNNMDEEQAIACALDNPSIIKRPLIIKDGQYLLGFSADTYNKFLID